MTYCVTSGNGEQSANYEKANVEKLKGTTQVTTLHVLAHSTNTRSFHYTTLCKPGVSAELSLRLRAFTGMFAATQFETPVECKTNTDKFGQHAYSLLPSYRDTSPCRSTSITVLLYLRK